MSRYLNIPIVETTNELLHNDLSLPSHDINAPLTWRLKAVPGYLVQPDFFINLKIHVWKMVGGHKRDIDDADKLCLTNYPIGSLFKSASIEFRDKPITAQNTRSAYVQYMRILKEFDKDGRDSLLESSLWVQDLAGSHNVFERNDKIDRDPYTTRHEIIIDGAIVDLYGPLMLDICRTEFPFPDDVDMTIRLYRESVEFALTGDKPPAGTSYHISIHRADLCVTRLRMEPGVSFYKTMGPVVSFPFTEYETRSFVIAAGQRNIQEDIVNTFAPARVMIAMLDQEAFNGTFNKNGFEFPAYDIESVFLRKNQTTSIPPEPYTTKLWTVVTPNVSGTGGSGAGGAGAGGSGAGGAGAGGSGAGGSGTGGAGGSSGGAGGGTGGSKNVRFRDDHDSRRKGKRSREFDDEEAYEIYKQYKRHKRALRDPNYEYEERPHHYHREKRQTDPAAPKTDPPTPPVTLLREYSRLYLESLRVLNTTGGPLNRINQNISMADFIGGYCILAFDLQTDRTLSVEEQVVKYSQQPQAVIRLEATFHKPLPNSIVVLCLLEYPRQLQIPDSKLGRSWRKEDLRKKNNKDLHKLWYVLLKERNMLLTMQRSAKDSEDADEMFPNPERIDKVEESMTALEEVVRERNRAVMELESGETGERPSKTVTSILGFRVKQPLKEHILPPHQAGKVKQYELPYLSNDQYQFQKLWKEKLWLEERNKEDDRKRLAREHKRLYKY